LALALAYDTLLLLLAGDYAGERVEQLVAVAAEQSYPYWVAAATIFRGSVKIKNGDVAEGISLLGSGLTAYRATGAESFMLHYISLLAGAYEIAGQVGEALSLFDDALPVVERTG
jgi:predicted ATPase